MSSLEAGKKCPPGKTPGKNGQCRRKLCRGSKTRDPVSHRCRQPKKSGHTRGSAPKSPRTRSPRSRRAYRRAHPMKGGEVDQVIVGGSVPEVVAQLAAGSVEAPLEAGKRKECKSGQTRDPETKHCRRKLCRGSKTRDPVSHRCRQPKKSGHTRGSAPKSPRTRSPRSRRAFRRAHPIKGGEVVPVEQPLLTAGALEEAFQAGLTAGRGF